MSECEYVSEKLEVGGGEGGSADEKALVLLLFPPRPRPSCAAATARQPPPPPAGKGSVASVFRFFHLRKGALHLKHSAGDCFRSTEAPAEPEGDGAGGRAEGIMPRCSLTLPLPSQ